MYVQYTCWVTVKYVSWFVYLFLDTERQRLTKRVKETTVLKFRLIQWEPGSNLVVQIKQCIIPSKAMYYSK